MVSDVLAENWLLMIEVSYIAEPITFDTRWITKFKRYKSGQLLL